MIPYHRIGGAEKVHSEIIKAVSSHRKTVIIFEYTDGSSVSQDFKKHLHFDLGNSRLRKILCMMLIATLSRVFQLTIFGCNSPFFYRLISKVSSKTVTIDLTHAFSHPDLGIEEVAKHYIPFISKRIVVNHMTLDDYRNQYLREGISLNYLQRFQIIPNGIYIHAFDERLIQERFKNFTIGFVGRYSREKRPELFLELSRMRFSFQCRAKIITDKFNEEVSNHASLNMVIGVTDPERIRAEFSTISVLVVTSAREGFPLTIMEAMELGIPVIATNVGSIHEHVINDYNGFVSDTIEEEMFVTFCHQKIELLGNDQKLYTDLSMNARQHAVEHFNIDGMQKAYRELFFQ